MKREVELGILDELLAQLGQGRNVDAGVMYRNPTASYTCPDIAQREQELFVFGRNEPALHHYHTHFRDALGMEPLERIDP